MANQFGINVGEMYRDIENIKGARTRNKLAKLELSEKERMIEKRPEKERLEGVRQNKLAEYRQGAMSSDPKVAEQATQQLLSIDPVEGGKFIEALGKMDDRKRKTAQANVEQMGKMASFVLSGKSEEEQNKRYIQMLNTLPPETLKTMPNVYDPNFMEVSLAKAQSMATLLENPKSVRFGEKDVLYKGGRKVEEATRPTTGKGGVGASGLKSGDESFISREVTELLGGFYDNQGNLRLTDKNLLSKAQGIKTLAANIFLKSGGKISRSEAVKQAAKEFGEKVSDVPNKDATNKFAEYLK